MCLSENQRAREGHKGTEAHLDFGSVSLKKRQKHCPHRCSCCSTLCHAVLSGFFSGVTHLGPSFLVGICHAQP